MDELVIARQNFERLGENYPKESSVVVEPAQFGGVSCYWFTPEDALPERIILYSHGGAFAAGSIRSHASLVTHIAKRLRTKILFVDYALAPEHPYPAGLNDVLTVYDDLLTSYPGYWFAVVGDSAGGGILVSAIGELLAARKPLPQAVVLISPWLSLRGTNPSYEENRLNDPVLTKEYLASRATMYRGSSALEEVSPDNTRLSSFPPVLIMVGTNEILLDDSRHFYERVKTMQPHATLTLYEKQNHVWPLADVHSPAAQQALTEMADFLNALHESRPENAGYQMSRTD